MAAVFLCDESAYSIELESMMHDVLPGKVCSDLVVVQVSEHDTYMSLASRTPYFTGLCIVSRTSRYDNIQRMADQLFMTALHLSIVVMDPVAVTVSDEWLAYAIESVNLYNLSFGTGAARGLTSIICKRMMHAAYN